MDDMEAVVQQLHDPRPTQHSTSNSINLGRSFQVMALMKTTKEALTRGTTPMDIEEEPPNPLAETLKCIAS
jgi:hypothetical protein